ncbi:MAG: hypothetical protein V1845_01170 [bacterium]
MIGFFKKKAIEWRLRAKLRKQFSPRPEFLAYCRAIFLEKAAQRNPAGQTKLAGGFYFASFARYSLVSFFVLLFLGSGAAVYADATNVSYGHPLYNFKLAVETVRVKVAPGGKAAVLRTEFAERRVQEIKIVTTQKPMAEAAESTKAENVKDGVQTKAGAKEQEHQQKMADLRSHLKKQVDLVVEEIEEKKAKSASAAELCDSMSRVMKEDEEIDREETKEEHEQSWARFKKNCSEFMNDKDSGKVKNRESSND